MLNNVINVLRKYGYYHWCAVHIDREHKVIYLYLSGEPKTRYQSAETDTLKGLTTLREALRVFTSYAILWDWYKYAHPKAVKVEYNIRLK